MTSSYFPAPYSSEPSEISTTYIYIYICSRILRTVRSIRSSRDTEQQKGRGGRRRIPRRHYQNSFYHQIPYPVAVTK